MNADTQPEVITQETQRFQGTWQQIACEADGIANPPEDYGIAPLVKISGNEFTVLRADGTVAIKGTFSLASLHDPKQMDWTDTFGVDAGKTFPAIYCFDGELFIFCAADVGMERPKAFHTQVGQVLRVHRRVADPVEVVT